MRTELKYIRTDRNGTQYFHDWNCPRCGGAGQSDKWLMTGRTCYACGGTGKRSKPLVVKKYTDEYAAKLEARRVAKLAKWEADHAEEIAQAKAKAAQFAEEVADRAFQSYGLGTDGVGYILRGNTYPIKAAIKAAGGCWVFGVWVCPIEFVGKGVGAQRIDLSACRAGYGTAAKISDALLDAI